ncbi:cytochrome p450 monooxygenase [Paraphoma chrysanthemicola]|nr:cytochrome p450 monooxygenase [Paraphoma chrysanthemicola]
MTNVRIAALAIVLPAVLVYYAIKCFSIGRRPKDLPPGPPTLPLLGNIHLMPKEKSWLQLSRWAEEYGPIYSLMMGTQTYIVLNSPEAVRDLMDKRSQIYSSRPDMYVAQEVASGGLRLVVMKYGALWRTMHKMIHNIFNIRAAVTYVPYQDLENKQMLSDFLDNPQDFVNHIRRFSNSLTTQMVFGVRTHTHEDPRLRQLFEGFQEWSEIAGGTSTQLLDLYPILQKLPAFLRPNFRYAQQLHKKELGLYSSHWMEAKKALLDGTGKPCFSNDVLRVQEKEKMNDDQAAYLSGSLLEAGSDTTSSTLIGFVLAMLSYSDVQQRAKEEIDRVVGPDRLPNIDDWPNLPYIRAIIKETIRWMPTTVSAVPHRVLEENFYQGYRIPRDATVLINVWGLHMDPKRNPNPRVFDPTRFENDLRTEFECATGDPSKRNNYIFGAGRRLCQGMHIAERSLFLATTRMLWAFNFERPRDHHTGMLKPLPDVDEFHGTMIIQPAPFEVVITPRTQKKASMIKKIWRDAEEELLDKETKQWAKMPEGMAFSTYEPGKVNA